MGVGEFGTASTACKPCIPAHPTLFEIDPNEIIIPGGNSVTRLQRNTSQPCLWCAKTGKSKCPIKITHTLSRPDGEVQYYAAVKKGYKNKREHTRRHDPQIVPAHQMSVEWLRC